MSFKILRNPETSHIYRREAIDMALGWCPIIYPCKKCKHPVFDGYCCNTCQTNEPDLTKEESKREKGRVSDEEEVSFSDLSIRSINALRRGDLFTAGEVRVYVLGQQNKEFLPAANAMAALCQLKNLGKQSAIEILGYYDIEDNR